MGTRGTSSVFRPVLVVLALTGLPGCLSSLASGAMADALSGSGGVYGQDDDPELVRDATPFALKTMEGVLVSQPEHVGLLTALASGFVQYGYAFVAQDAHRIEEDDYEGARVLVARARKLYARGRGYGLRGLEARHEGFTAELTADSDAALARLEAEDVPLVYWTAAAWGLWIASGDLEPEAMAQFPTVQALAARALALDPAWNDGTLHELFVTLETAAPGGSVEKASQHYTRALELNGGRRAGTYVSYAENICVKTQDSRAFHRALAAALAIDVDAHPDDRLANVIMQRRARRLEARSEDLFLEDVRDADTASTARGSL